MPTDTPRNCISLVSSCGTTSCNLIGIFLALEVLESFACHGTENLRYEKVEFIDIVKHSANCFRCIPVEDLCHHTSFKTAEQQGTDAPERHSSRRGTAAGPGMVKTVKAVQRQFMQ